MQKSASKYQIKFFEKHVRVTVFFLFCFVELPIFFLFAAFSNRRENVSFRCLARDELKSRCPNAHHTLRDPPPLTQHTLPSKSNISANVHFNPHPTLAPNRHTTFFIVFFLFLLFCKNTCQQLSLFFFFVEEPK